MLPSARRLKEHCHCLDNDLDKDDWGELSAPPIPGSPDGWIPLGPLINFICYCPKFDAPTHLFNIDNMGRWSKFVFQPRYGTGEKSKIRSVQGKKSAGHT